LITDYDVGLEGNPDIKPVTHEEVLKVFERNNDKLRGLLMELVSTLPTEFECSCEKAVE